MTGLHDFTSLTWNPHGLQPLLTYLPIRWFLGGKKGSVVSRNTWSNRQIWPSSTKWSRAKDNRVFPREHTGHSKHPLPTTQEKTTHGHCHMVDTKIRLIIFFAAKDGETLYSQKKTRLGADCGWDHELLIVKFRLILKKIGKTTRPFRYGLNQIPYDYTVEVMNRFKELDLIECLRNYGRRFVTLYRRQGSRPSPWKRNAKKQNCCLGRPDK